MLVCLYINSSNIYIGDFLVKVQGALGPERCSFGYHNEQEALVEWNLAKLSQLSDL